MYHFDDFALNWIARLSEVLPYFLYPLEGKSSLNVVAVFPIKGLHYYQKFIAKRIKRYNWKFYF
jgi:hypothetical protein